MRNVGWVGFIAYLLCRNENVKMLSTTEIIHEAECLPVEERALVVDSLLRSLNQPDAAIDRKWVEVVRRRSEELRSGQLKGIPGEAVLARLRTRFPA